MDATPSPPSPPSMTAAERHRRNAEQGRALLEAWRASGLSAAAFARERGVQPHRISYWRLRLGDRGAALPAIAASDAAVAFFEVPPPTRSPVTITLSDGMRIDVGAGADLRAVFAALRGGVATTC